MSSKDEDKGDLNNVKKGKFSIEALNMAVESGSTNLFLAHMILNLRCRQRWVFFLGSY